MRALVSACLLGVCCRYDGKSKPCPAVMALSKEHELIPVCPEQLGGLPTPRMPAEEAARLYALLGCDAAILKSNSPSCGSGSRYDGTFTGALTRGDGMTAALLKQIGARVLTEQEAEEGL